MDRKGRFWTSSRPTLVAEGAGLCIGRNIRETFPMGDNGCHTPPDWYVGARAILPLFVLLISVSLAGCTGPGNQSQMSKDQMSQSLDRFPAELQSGGRVKELSGSIDPSSGASTSFTIEYGQHGNLIVDAGPITAYCSDHGGVFEGVDGTIKAGRNRPELCEKNGRDLLSKALDAKTRSYEKWDSTSYRTSGTVRQILESGSENLVSFSYDASDKEFSSLEIQNATAEVTVRPSYAPRRPIAIPEADTRRAIRLDLDTSFANNTYSATVNRTEPAAPLDEFSILVRDYNDDFEKVNVTSFDPSDSSTQRDAGFTFRYDDNDGDGNLSVRDGFTIENREWEYSHEYDVVVWDEWADSETERFLPLPAYLSVLALMVGVVIARRFPALN